MAIVACFLLLSKKNRLFLNCVCLNNINQAKIFKCGSTIVKIICVYFRFLFLRFVSSEFNLSNLTFNLIAHSEFDSYTKNLQSPIVRKGLNKYKKIQLFC